MLGGWQYPTHCGHQAVNEEKYPDTYTLYKLQFGQKSSAQFLMGEGSCTPISQPEGIC